MPKTSTFPLDHTRTSAVSLRLPMQVREANPVAQDDGEMYRSFDARVWALAFVREVAANPSIAQDAETMTTWFASALMRGYDEAQRQQPMQVREEPSVAPVDDATALLFEAMDLAASVDMQDELFWQTTGGDKPPQLLVICNDLFYWASADAEPITRQNIGLLRESIQQLGADGWQFVSDLFCAKSRHMRPQDCAYPYERQFWPLFDACGPPRGSGSGNTGPRPGEPCPTLSPSTSPSTAEAITAPMAETDTARLDAVCEAIKAADDSAHRWYWH